MSKKIVFINQATGYLTIDVINEFAKEYDEVALITGSIRVQDTELHSSVKISKTIKYNRGNVYKKGISWIIGTIQIYFLLKLKYRTFEKFFYTIPPTAYLIARSSKTAYSILVFDLYPEALIINGFREKGFLYKWWAGKNRQIFLKAKRIFTLSENMKSMILNYSPEAKVEIISNWSSFSGFIPIPKHQNKIIKKEGLSGKFIVQYSGNIGATHNVETLIEVAELLKHQKDIEFLIIGRGDRKKAIGDMILKKALTNCKLLPFRKDEDLYESLCVADIAVITLDDKTPDISVPSKAYNILASGVPLMAIAPKNSSISEIISKYNAGESFERLFIKEMAEFIIDLKNNKSKWSEMAANSYEASKKFSSTNAVKYLDSYSE